MGSGFNLAVFVDRPLQKGAHQYHAQRLLGSECEQHKRDRDLPIVSLQTVVELHEIAVAAPVAVLFIELL